MSKLVWLAILVAALGWSAWTSLTQVESDQVGVVKRFGRIAQLAGPGLHIGLPWGIDRVERVSVDRFRQVTIGFDVIDSDEFEGTVPPGQLLTGDHNLVNVRASIDFTVSADDVSDFVLYGDQVDGMVARTADAALAQWVAGRGVDEVLLRGKVELPRWVTGEVQRRIDPYHLGVRIHLVSIGYLNPPQQVRDAFEAVTRAQAEIETKINDAKTEAETNWTAALAYKNKLERRAKVDADGKRNFAHAEADAFRKRLEQVHGILRQNPNYLAALWLDEMTRVYAKMYESGRLDLLDNRISGDGLDILQTPTLPKKK